MQIGVIAEGHSDRAVIVNILHGLIRIDDSDIIPLRPSYLLDETDKAALKDNTTSSYSIIKKECEEKELINGFFATAGHDFIAIHIDTAEADRYGVSRPGERKGNDNYCEELRELVISEINGWLGTDLSESILYAVAIEEIDAWVLTLHEQETTRNVDPKGKLAKVLSRKNVKFTNDPYSNYYNISKDLRKSKIINSKSIQASNCSLRLFCEEVLAKVPPKVSSDAESA